jgi:hypothetical protein
MTGKSLTALEGRKIMLKHTHDGLHECYLLHFEVCIVRGVDFCRGSAGLGGRLGPCVHIFKLCFLFENSALTFFIFGRFLPTFLCQFSADGHALRLCVGGKPKSGAFSFKLWFDFSLVVDLRIDLLLSQIAHPLHVILCKLVDRLEGVGDHRRTFQAECI